MTTCQNCRTPIESDRFCERCGAQNALPAGPDVIPSQLDGLFRLMQKVRDTGNPPDGADAEDARGFVRTLMGAIRGSEHDYVGAMAVKFLGGAIPEDRHPMTGVITRLTAGEPVSPEEMGQAMEAFAALRETLPVEQQFDRPLAALAGAGRRLAGLRIALTPMIDHLTDPAQRAFVRTQLAGLDRRIAAVAIESEMIRRGQEARLAGVGAAPDPEG